MKKKIIIAVIIVALLIVLLPIPMHLKDGGTVEYKSLIYKITKVRRLNNNSKNGYDNGIIVEILGIKIYDNVIVDNSNVNVENREKEITWEEITENGVNEELLLEKLDTQISEKIAKNLQDVIDEEIKDEQENPQIVITEGWMRIFNKEKYKEVISIGKPAMKPLYYILYKSENNDLYEFLCAKALQEISGIGGEITDDGTMQWSTAKEYLELFTEKVTK